MVNHQCEARKLPGALDVPVGFVALAVQSVQCVGQLLGVTQHTGGGERLQGQAAK